MGWWKVEQSEHVIGDEPLDVLADAAAAVVASYHRAHGRAPTPGEWGCLLGEALQAFPSGTAVEGGEGQLIRVEVLVSRR